MFKVNKIKKAALAFALTLAIGATVNAAQVVSDNVVHQGISGGKYYAQAYFNPSHEVQHGEGFSLTEGKHVKQAAVRAKSDGKKVVVKICSSYDSGWLWSSAASSKKTNKIISTPQATVTDCGTCVQRTSYTWKYF